MRSRMMCKSSLLAKSKFKVLAQFMAILVK